jgi:hypothetical protein
MNVCRWLLLCQLCTVMDGSDPVGRSPGGALICGSPCVADRLSRKRAVFVDEVQTLLSSSLSERFGCESKIAIEFVPQGAR